MNIHQNSLPETHNVENTVLQLAAMALNKQPDKIKPDLPLFSTKAGFDSFALIEFVLRLENAFNIKIPDQDLDPDIFHSVKTIASYISSRLE